MLRRPAGSSGPGTHLVTGPDLSTPQTFDFLMEERRS